MRIKTYFICFFISIVTVSFFISCNSSDDKSKTGIVVEVKNETKPSTENKVNDADNSLVQNGDYSSLFNRDKKDCFLLTATEFAAAINVSEEKLIKEDNAYSCSYLLKNDNGLNTEFSFTITPNMTKESITKEIASLKKDMKTLGEDSRLVHIQLSETGDTYLGMIQNRLVNIFNTNYETIITVFYNKKFKKGEKDTQLIIAQKDEARKQAFTVANYLLNKYKK